MQPRLDYTELEAVPPKKTLVYVNNFIISTAQFLNRFSYLCEQKLSNVSRKIQRLEITLSILESKLGSIPGIEAAPAEAVPPPADAPVAPAGDGAPPPPPPPGGAPPPPPPPAGGADGDAAPPPPPVEAQPDVLLNKNDPQYAKFFKMVNIGIPVPHVRQKMMMEGFDPSVLDAPDAPSGTGGSPAAADDVGPSAPGGGNLIEAGGELMSGSDVSDDDTFSDSF